MKQKSLHVNLISFQVQGLGTEGLRARGIQIIMLDIVTYNLMQGYRAHSLIFFVYSVFISTFFKNWQRESNFNSRTGVRILG